MITIARKNSLEMAIPFNPYECSTLQGNWYEERFFTADSRRFETLPRIRPLTDEIENIPRVSRRFLVTGDVFKPTNKATPEEHFLTMSQQTYVQHPRLNESITARRMNTSPEELRKILGADSTKFLPDYRMPYRGPDKQFKTTYRKSYVRHI
jgi:hypothetical protein